jgi:hypothetical protein
MEIFLSKPTPREQRECSLGKVALYTLAENPTSCGPGDSFVLRGPSNSRPAKGRRDRIRAPTSKGNSLAVPQPRSDAKSDGGCDHALSETREKVVAKHIPVFSWRACSRPRGVSETDLNTWGAKSAVRRSLCHSWNGPTALLSNETRLI